VKYKIGNGTEKEASIVETGTAGAYYVYLDDIYANQYDSSIQVKFYNGSDQVGQTLNYSVNSYLASKKASAGTLGDLLNAINNYGNAAKAYVVAQ